MKTARFIAFKSLIFAWLLVPFCGFAFGKIDSLTPTLGVNRPGIAWLKPDSEWKRTIDTISASGVKSLRMMLVTPYENSYEVISYCNQKDIKVLLMVPLTLDIYYNSPLSRRPGNKNINAVPRLSQLNISNFELRWKEVIKSLSLRGLRINSLQIGNEFNSADFNGDLPLVRGGAILSFQNHREFPFWSDYETGMLRLVQVLRIVSGSLHESKQYKDVPIVLGGLARPSSTWIKNVDASLIEPNIALKVLLDLDADRYIDFYAIHLYPQVPNDQWLKPEVAIQKYIDTQMTEVIAVAGTAKAWWVTEWGFSMRNKNPDKCAKEDERLPLFRAFYDALENSRWAHLIGPTFIYDWDESERFRILTSGLILCTDKQIKNILPTN